MPHEPTGRGRCGAAGLRDSDQSRAPIDGGGEIAFQVECIRDVRRQAMTRHSAATARPGPEQAEGEGQAATVTQYDCAHQAKRQQLEEEQRAKG
jgi:hypothetical protein